MPDIDTDFETAQQRTQAFQQKAAELRSRSATLHASLSANCEALAATREQTRSLIAETRTLCAPRQRTMSSPPSDRAAEMVDESPVELRHGEADLNLVLDVLIAVYVQAMEVGKQEAANSIRQALFHIGRYVAAETGPRAAGLTLN